MKIRIWIWTVVMLACLFLVERVAAQELQNESIQILQSKAYAGDAAAQFSLGKAYANGTVTEKNPDKAIYWYKLSASQGFVNAQYNLGFMYEGGSGVEADAYEAARWYALAAEKGDADAQFIVGYFYATGKGVVRDPAKAVGWFRRSAEQGLASAQFNLASHYLGGSGVPKSLEDARMWYEKAAQNGFAPASEALDIMERSAVLTSHRSTDIQVSRLEALLFGKSQPFYCGKSPNEAYLIADKIDAQELSRKKETGVWNDNAIAEKNSAICYARACEGGHGKACLAFWGGLESISSNVSLRPQLFDLVLDLTERACNAGEGIACGSLAEFYGENRFETEETLASWCEEDFNDGLCPQKMEKFMYKNWDKAKKFAVMGCGFEYSYSCYKAASLYFEKETNEMNQMGLPYLKESCRLQEYNSDGFCDRWDEVSYHVDYNLRMERAEKVRKEKARRDSIRRKENANNFFSALLSGVVVAIEADRVAGLTPQQRAAERERERIRNLSLQEQVNEMNATLAAAPKASQDKTSSGGRTLTLTGSCSLPEWQRKAGTCKHNGRTMSPEEEATLKAQREAWERDSEAGRLASEKRAEEAKNKRLKQCSDMAARGIYSCGCPRPTGSTGNACMK